MCVASVNEQKMMGLYEFPRWGCLGNGEDIPTLNVLKSKRFLI